MKTQGRLLGAVFFAMMAFVSVADFRLSYAKDPAFTTPPSGFRIGMEIELTPEAFANLTGYFDYDKLQAERGASIAYTLPSDFFDDYLRDYPQALSELPEPLRKTLTQGLQLENAVIHKAQPPPSSFIGTDGKALDSQPKIVLPNAPAAAKPPAQSQLILPNATHPVAPRPQPPIHAENSKPTISAKAIQQQGDLLVPKNVAWQTLYDRWKALDPGVKRSLVRWEHLSPRKKAILAITYADGNIHTKANLPPEEKRLFERLSWSRDLKPIEFRHREDLIVSDPNEFYQDVLHLAQRAGIERRILDPESSRLRSGGLHFHISVQGKDLTEEGKAFNRLALIRRINVGILNDLTDDRESYLYERSAQDKGHVRIVKRDRLEFRAHNVPLRDELGFILKTLQLDSTHAVKAIEAEIKNLMSDYVVDKIAEHRSEYLEDFTQNMTPEQRRRIQPVIELHAYLKGASKTLPGDFWDRAPALLASKDHSIQSKTAAILEKQSKWPKEFWEHVPALMESKNTRVQSALSFALGSQSTWPKVIWDRVPALMASKDASVQSAILFGLGSQSTWPKEIWDRIPALMTSKESYTQSALSFALGNQSTWPKEFWAHVPALMASEDPYTLSAISTALKQQSTWPKEFWDHVPALTASKDRNVRAAILSVLRQQSKTGTVPCIHQQLSTLLR